MIVLVLLFLFLELDTEKRKEGFCVRGTFERMKNSKQQWGRQRTVATEVNQARYLFKTL